MTEGENRGETPMQARTIGITPPEAESWSPGVERPTTRTDALRTRYQSVTCPYCGAAVCQPCVATSMLTGHKREAMWEHESRMALVRIDAPRLLSDAS